MLYIVYRVTNNLSKRQYIGAHKTNDINDCYMGSGVLIKQAIKKHGVENFSKEILYKAESSEEMYAKEIELIELHTPEYNLHKGGNGGWDYINENCQASKGFQWINENNLNNKSQQNVKGSKTHRERLKNDPEYYTKWKSSLGPRDGENNVFYGKKHTDETKRKISESNKKLVGPKNSRYGTMWITNGVVNKMIHRTTTIPVGFYKGRVM